MLHIVAALAGSVRLMRKDRPDLLATFRHLPLFADCTEEELLEIDSLADEAHVPAGRDLFRQGDVGREFAVVTEGEVIIRRDDVEVARIGPGGWIGELALLASVERTATVTAAVDTTVQVIDRRGFQTLLEDSPSLTLNLLRATAARLAALEDEASVLRQPD